MAHPKSRISKQRKNKRRTHYKAVPKTLAICPTTGESHIFHRAHWHENKLYHKGKVVLEREA